MYPSEEDELFLLLFLGAIEFEFGRDEEEKGLEVVE
ncbi:hypothetical protein A2U01_0064214 [Trifolium medium]|uniref:Uncharacterized protein n=1 Tax=Trifolium medium TaxID=97028 RepID=A0A392S3M0_9FABA|nr:hypothetical protein [Trifolium medium]